MCVESPASLSRVKQKKKKHIIVINAQKNQKLKKSLSFALPFFFVCSHIYFNVALMIRRPPLLHK